MLIIDYNSKMKSEDYQDNAQDPLYNIASAISEANFNIRHFKKQQLAKPLTFVTNNTRTRAVSKIFTQSNTHHDTMHGSGHSQVVPQGLNNSLKFQDTFIPPVKPKQYESETKIKTKNYSSTSSDRYSKRQASFKQNVKAKAVHRGSVKLENYERQWSKGKMKDKCMQEWLNAICMEYFPNQYFDRKIPNCALKKLSIDENSLIAKGLNPKNISRLYRSLFVFGMGYNEFVAEMARGNMELTKTLWKIYSVVVEYCSRGNLQTVVGDIERENSLKLVDLSSELQRKQLIIQKNEELNEKKNSEIFKEIKQLREQNINLVNEKTVLVDEYNSTEQAFSEQVNLRLKFETKINQIYGLHRQLGNKHQKLHQDLVTKAQELKVEADKYFQVVNRISEYKQVQLDLREQLTFYKEKSKRQTKYLQESNREIVTLTSKITELEYNLDCFKNLYQEIKIKEKQWEIERANMNVVVSMREKSTKETYKQYQITLEQNNRLYISLSDQRKVMDEHEKEKKNFNSKIISILSENSYNKRKLEEKNKDYQLLQEKYSQLVAQKQSLLHQNQIYAKNQESLNVYFQTVQQNISQMHKLNIDQTEELSSLRLFHQNVTKMLDSKNSKADNLMIEYTKLSEAHQNLKKQYSKLQSQFNINNQKIKHLQQSFLLREEMLNVARSQLEEKSEKMEKMIKQKNQEMEELGNSLDKVVREYKNQKFERTALNNAYLQALMIVQSKNQEEKNLNVRLSLLEGELTSQKHKYLLLEKNTVKLISDFSALQEQLEQTLEEQRQTLTVFACYRHPMIIQDLQAQLSRLHDQYDLAKKKILSLEMTLQRERVLHRQQMERQSSELRWQISKNKTEAERKIQNLNGQVSFERQQIKNLKTKLEQLQMVAETYRKKINEKTTSQRQQVYKYMLEEKKKQIQSLLLDIEKLQDQLAKAKKALAETTVAYQNDLIASQQQTKANFEEALRKELQHQFELRIRDTQRSLKAQYLRKQQQLRDDQSELLSNLSLEEILKIKNIKPQQVITELAKKLGQRSQGGDLYRQKYKSRGFGERGPTGQSLQELRKRQEIGRLIKNAAQYYEH